MTNEFNQFVSIQLTKNEKNALYVQLYNQIIELIHSRVLAPGYRLPSVRKFSQYLSINPGTVVNAYKELEKSGYVISHGGSGSYIAEKTSLMELDMGTVMADCTLLEEGWENKQNGDMINMRSIALNPDVISIKKFKELVIKVLDRDKGKTFSYEGSQGFLPLRESVVTYLKERHVSTSAKNIQVISGAQQGIDIVVRALLNHGDYVFTESPTYPGAIAAFRSAGAKVIDIPMEPDGIDVIKLEKYLQRFRPKLIYVMPILQNPTGISYSIEKRNRFMELMRYYDVCILEDDYLSELSFRTSPLAPLKALDRDDRVIYIKSFSKMFMPGLRLAFLCIPEYLAERILKIKYITDISTSGLTQRVFDLYLREGVWQEHIAHIRKIYKAQFDFAYQVAQHAFSDKVIVQNPQGGLSFWIRLPQKILAKEFCLQAEKNHVYIACGDDFYPRHIDQSHIRISFSLLSLQQVEAGFHILGELIQERM
ncbi:PLP-dependent aminotransferase family protein [Megasphaera sueciensis]|uniref:MocR-like pyridoxine biosynthesis transcription factor PdxR n=1 Tax=Megasphaera sueciensis TaxID=349094 RepID=UPI003D035FE4